MAFMYKYQQIGKQARKLLVRDIRRYCEDHNPLIEGTHPTDAELKLIRRDAQRVIRGE